MLSSGSRSVIDRRSRGCSARSRTSAGTSSERAAVGNARGPQVPGDAARRRREVRLGRLELREHALGVRDEPPSGLGEPQPAAVALDELHAGLALERGELLADGGRRHPERLGRRGDAASGRDLAEDAHALHVQHVAQLTLQRRKRKWT